MPTIAQLIAESIQIRDETIPGANSANRVGTLFKNISDTFATVAGNANSAVVPFNDKAINRNTLTPLVRFDLSANNPTNFGGSFVVRFYLLFNIPNDMGSGAQSGRIIAETHIISTNQNGTLFVINNIAATPGETASVFPLNRNIQDTVPDFTQPVAGRWDIAIDLFDSGTFGGDIRAFGYIEFMWSNYVGAPVITLL